MGGNKQTGVPRVSRHAGPGPDAESFGGGAAFTSGGILFLGLFAVLLAQEIGWWLGVHPGAWSILAGVLVAAFFTLIQVPPLRRQLFGLWGIGLPVAGAGFFVLYGLQDPSWDGPAYHAPAVVQMLQGWNPVRGETGLWILDQYPHGPWAIRAALVDVAGGDLSAGRLLTVLAAMGLFAMTAGFVASALRIRPAAAMGVAALVVANPVVVGQVWTDYVDGLLGIYALAYMLSLFALRGPRPWWALLLAISLAVLTATTKAAGLYYVFVITLLVMAWHGYKSFGDKKSMRGTFGRFAALTGMVVLLLVITAWRPYVTNLQDHQALVYPPADRVLADQRPANLQGAGPAARALYLVFSEARSGRGQGDPLTLRPFDLSRDALQSSIHDARSAGFGPLFGVQMLVAVGIALWAVAKRQQGDSRLMFAVVVCLAASFAFPESWWARFVPLVWAGAVFLAAPVLGGGFGAGKMRLFAATVFVLLVLANSLPFAGTGWQRAQDRTQAFKELAEALQKEPAVALEGSKDNYFDVSHGYMLGREGVNVAAGAPCAGQVIHRDYSDHLVICRVPF